MATPTVSVLSPTNGATNVDIQISPVVTFSENVFAATGNDVIIKKYSDDSVIETIDAADSQITISGADVTIDISASLQYGVKYYVAIEAGAFEDASANGCGDLTSKALWSFTIRNPIYTETYDKFHYELSIVSNADKTDVQAVIACYYDFNIRAIFNDVDEITFTLPYIVDVRDGTTNPVWDEIREASIIKMETKRDDTVYATQYFIVQNPEYLGGDMEVKKIQAYSREYTWAKKRIRTFTYSTQVYDSVNSWDSIDPDVNPDDSGIMNYIIEEILYDSWSISYMSASLDGEIRAFSISNKSLIEVVKEIQKQFNCVILFDTSNNTIGIYTYDEIGTNTGLVLDKANYIKSANKKIRVDEIVTRLYVDGKDETVINARHITGKPYIDDFSYFRTTAFMSQDLLDALTQRDNAITANAGTFTGYLSDLATKQTELTDLYYNVTTGLYALQADLVVIEDHLDVCIRTASTSGGFNYTYWRGQEATKIADIATKQAEITTKDGEITTVQGNMTTLAASVDYDQFLSPAEFIEFTEFIYEGDVKCNTTDDEILYDYGVYVSARKAQPTIDFSLDITDVFGAKSEQFTWDKLDLGDLVYLTYEELGIDTEVRVMAYTRNIDSNSLSFDFSNREFWNNDLVYLNELIAKANQTADTMEDERDQYNDYYNNDKDTISDFITSDIDTSTNQVVMEDGTILSRRGMYMHDDSTDNDQMRILGNRIVFTQDNWDTYSTSITASGVKTDGNFKLYNDGNLVIIDGDGLKIYGGSGSDPIQIWNENNYKVFNLDSDGNIQLNNEDGSSTILDSYGMDTKFIKWFKNMCNNSSFELYDDTTYLPDYWSGTGVSSGDSSWFGSRSCKLTTTGDYIQTHSLYAINPNFYDDIVTSTNLTRISFHKKRGKVKVEVLDLDNASQAYALTDTDGNTGTYLEFAYNLNYVPESYSFNFDHFEFGATTQFIVKFTNTDATTPTPYDAYIDAVIIEPDYTGKRPSFYTDGANSINIATLGGGVEIVVGTTAPTDTTKLWLDTN